ncbi:MAG: ribose 5-phosphate isomerase B [Acidobacteriota bacterium]
MRVALGADHAGFDLKEQAKDLLRRAGDIQIEDLGAHSAEASDYPVYAARVAEGVSRGEFERGILFCGSGIGMDIVANRYPRVRAALVYDEQAARLSRQHNDANVLVLGARLTKSEQALEIIRQWLQTRYEGGRHQRRLDLIDQIDYRLGAQRPLREIDPEIAEAIRLETARQGDSLELIASENFVSEAVLEAVGSVLTNKYAEGYPGRRYYGGCEFVDRAETLAIERVKKIFGADHANVQPHSGTQANIAAYLAVLQPGDKILGLNLAHGGHLSHGHPLNFSGKYFQVSAYGVDPKTERIDYTQLAEIAQREKPKMIVSGASAYARTIEYEKIWEIARGVGAMHMADIAHVAGLVAAGLHPSPVPYADFVTSTTHKTLRGPRGGFVLCRAEHAKALDRLVFPGTQGGPLMHVIAAKAVCFHEALQPEFKDYQARVLRNARALCETVAAQGFRIVSGGTDNHLFLVDVFSRQITGKDAEKALDAAHITVNKNAIPFDTQPPMTSSGIRIGTPAVTTRGMGEPEMHAIGKLIARVLENLGSEAVLGEVRKEVADITQRFPLYSRRRMTG